MCSHSQIINRLRVLLSELQARASVNGQVKCDCGCDSSQQAEPEQQATGSVHDHREVCSSIDGCDSTR